MDQPLKTQVQSWLSRLGPALKKFKYPALVLLVGLFLLLLPSKKVRSEPENNPTEPVQAMQEPLADDYRRTTEQELARILSQIDGAGRVEVMLTLRSGPAVQYQTDFEREQQSDSLMSRQNTVILQRNGAYDEAAVVKTDYPAFQGALVVSQGAADPTVRLALADAVAALLGLGMDKITVVKMK